MAISACCLRWFTVQWIMDPTHNLLLGSFIRSCLNWIQWFFELGLIFSFLRSFIGSICIKWISIWGFNIIVNDNVLTFFCADKCSPLLIWLLHRSRFNKGYYGILHPPLKCNLVNLEIPIGFLYYGNPFGISKSTRLHFNILHSSEFHISALLRRFNE